MACTHFDKDQSFNVVDFGPAGYVGNVTVNLAGGLTVGSLLSVVARSDQEIPLHVKDAMGNNLITIAARVSKDDFIMNSYLNKVWGSEERPAKNPVRAGARTVISLLFDVEGYRVIVNDAQVAFYKHRSPNAPRSLEVHNSQVFKVLYLTPVDVVPS